MVYSVYSMKREVIIISDLDLEICKFIKVNRSIEDIGNSFNISHSMIKRHLDRLNKLNMYQRTKRGHYRLIKLNDNGRLIYRIIWQQIYK